MDAEEAIVRLRGCQHELGDNRVLVESGDAVTRQTSEAIRVVLERLAEADAAWKVNSAILCLQYNDLNPEKQEKHSRGIHEAVLYVKEVEAANESLQRENAILQETLDQLSLPHAELCKQLIALAADLRAMKGAAADNPKEHNA